MGRRGTGVYKHGQGYKGSKGGSEVLEITQEMLNELIIDPVKGKISYRDPDKHGSRNKGKLGYKIYRADGFPKAIRFNFKNVQYQAHRVIFMYVHGYCPSVIDHADGNPFNNNIENLRAADPTLNKWNAKVFRNNKSGLTGVVWHKATDQWRARLNAKGICYELGFTDSKFEAACLRKAAELKMFGSFQRV